MPDLRRKYEHLDEPLLPKYRICVFCQGCYSSSYSYMITSRFRSTSTPTHGLRSIDTSISECFLSTTKPRLIIGDLSASLTLCSSSCILIWISFLLSFFLWHGYDVSFFLFFFSLSASPPFSIAQTLSTNPKSKKKRKKKSEKENSGKKKKTRASGLTAWTAKRIKLLYTAVRSKGASLGVVYTVMNHG